MRDDLAERLIAAIEANTQAQLEMAKAITDMADQSAALVEIVASGGEASEDEPATDLAGNPIRTT